MGNITLKNIVIVGVIFFVIAGITDFLEHNNYEYKRLFKLSTWKNSESIDGGVQEVNDTVYIRGLGRYTKSDLLLVSKEITKVFGFNCKIIEPVKTYPKLYVKNTNRLDENTCSKLLNSQKKTVYVTKECLSNKNISGAATHHGKFIIISNDFNHIKKTTLHEMGHTLGMDHCTNNKCVMATRNIMTCNNQFCNDCKTKLGLQ